MKKVEDTYKTKQVQTEELSKETDLKDKLTCERCNKTFENLSIMNSHVCAPKLPTSNINCDQCEYVATDVQNMVSHLLSVHGRDTKIDKCLFCECESTNSQTLAKHIKTNHEDVSILNSLVEEQSNLNLNLDLFKKDISKLFDVVLEDQLEFKKQLMNMSIGRNEQIRALDDTVKQLAKLVMKIYDHQTGEAPDMKAKTTERAQPSTNNFAEFVMPKEDGQKNTNKKPWILFVGGTIGHNAEFQKLERATGSLIKTARAYSSVPDMFEDIDDTRMAPTKFRHNRLPDVVKSEVTKRAYETLVIQPGSEDITNMNTNENPKENFPFFKNKVIQDAQSVIKSAEEALEIQSTLKKVTVMPLIPRFDDKRTDPLSIKSVLTDIYNKTLIQAWLESESESKNKIYVGVHDLYGPSGRKDYTRSVMNIFKGAQMLKSTFSLSMESSKWSKPPTHQTNKHMEYPQPSYQKDVHTDCPQARYQRRAYPLPLPSYQKDGHTDCPQARYQRGTYSDAVKSNLYRVSENKEHGTRVNERMEYRVPTNNRFAPLNY